MWTSRPTTSGPAAWAFCKRGNFTRQQARQDAMDDDGQERTLQGSRRPHGVDQINFIAGTPAA